MAQTADIASLTLPEILSGLTPTPAAYLRAMRQVEALPGWNPRRLKVAMVSTYTTELVRPYLVVECARRGLGATLHFAPYNQLEQQLLDPGSPLYQFAPDVIVLGARLEDFAGRLVEGFLKLSASELAHEIESVTGRMSNLIAGIRRCSNARILVFNFAPPAILSGGLADASCQPSQASVIQQINDRLSQVCRETADATVFDYARLVTEFGRRCWQDPKLFYLGRIPWRLEAQIETAGRLARYLRALYVAPCKCLVLDLDNTLWGGVLGEEGIGGIHLGEDFPGNIYKDFQRYLSALRVRGILLAIASKNNEADVLELFEKHADCVLRLSDFAAHRINWEDKPLSLQAIARELGIGTDALAFFDDNPVERELVRARMPEVAVIDAPKDPLGYIDAIEQSGVFDALTISGEDRQRHEMYGEQRRRSLLQARCASTEDFLRELETTATIGTVGPDTLERVTQLIGKTNQFNLTTRRHGSAELQQMLTNGIGLWLRVSDRFGDNGLVGVVIAIPNAGGQWLIDTFLLSCRVIGRRVETVLLGAAVRMIAARGGREVMGEFIPTAKNGLAADFYPKHGFEICGEKKWRLDATRGILLPDHVRLVDETTK